MKEKLLELLRYVTDHSILVIIGWSLLICAFLVKNVASIVITSTALVFLVVHVVVVLIVGYKERKVR